MRVSVSSRDGRALGDYDVGGAGDVAALKAAICAAKPRLYPARVRLSRPAEKGARAPALADDAALVDGEGLVFKDLGPQISWKWVFVAEYFGPLVLYPLLYMQPAWVYGGGFARDAWREEVQFAAVVAWTVHYAKRELETLFVHRFSHATMPLFNLFKNCMYYWGFAAYVGYFVNHPLYTPPNQDMVYSGLCLFYFMEVGNFTCHWTLRSLRPPGTRVRAIPTGGLFDYVTCPNYFYEICAWFGFNLMTRTVAGVLFMLAGATQMFIWAAGKHRNYEKEFDGKDGRRLYPESRKIIVPFVY